MKALVFHKKTYRRCMSLSIAAKMLELLLARDWGWLLSKSAWNFTEGKFLWGARWDVVRHLHSRFPKGIRDKSRRGVNAPQLLKQFTDESQEYSAASDRVLSAPPC